MPNVVLGAWESVYAINILFYLN